MSSPTIKKMGFAANLAASLFFALRAPTDSIRVWYPTLWSFLGEHFLLFLVCLSCLFFVVQRLPANMRGSLRSRDNLGLSMLFGYGILTVGSDVLASAYLWFVALQSGGLPTLSYPRDNFWNYLWLRELVFVSVFLTGVIGQHFVRRAPGQERLETSKL